MMAKNFKMVTVGVSIELHKRMKALDWVNWSAVGRKAFEEKLKELEKNGSS